MMPDFPDLTKCKKCNTIVWLSKLKDVEVYKWSYTDGQKVDKAEFLEIDDYYKALNDGIAENLKDELFIRQRIWWAYNDRIRNGSNIFIDENDELRWKENCNKLILLLDQSDLNQNIMIAELHRNLGDFDACIDIVRKINKVDMIWLKEIFIIECERKNRWVVLLNR